MSRTLLAFIVTVASMNVSAADSSGSEVMQSYTRARAVLDAGVAAMGGAEALTAVTSIPRDFEAYRTNTGQTPKPFGGAPTIDVLSASTPISGPDASGIVPRINALGWKVQRMLPTHGVAASVEELNRSLEIRAKYVKGADTRHRLR